MKFRRRRTDDIPLRRRVEYASLLEIVLAGAMSVDLGWHLLHMRLLRRAVGPPAPRLESPPVELEGTREVLRLADGLGAAAPSVPSSGPGPGDAPVRDGLRDAPDPAPAARPGAPPRRAPATESRPERKREAWRTPPAAELPHLRDPGPARRATPESGTGGRRGSFAPHPGRFRRPPGGTVALSTRAGDAEPAAIPAGGRGTTPHPNPAYAAMRGRGGAESRAASDPGRSSGPVRSPGAGDSRRPAAARTPAARLRPGADGALGRGLNAHALLKGVDWDGARKGVRRGRSARGSNPVRAGGKSAGRAPGGRATAETAGRERRPLPNAPRPESVSLRDLLGRSPLEPPRDDPPPPDFSRLRDRQPPRLPGGKTLRPDAASPKEVEGLLPPSEEPGFAAWRAEDRGERRAEHWHAANGRLYWHGKDAWGVWSGKWSWMIRERGNWWVLAGRQPLLRHEGRWWWKSEGAWFLLRDGQPWAYRWFPEWKSAGLVHPGSGTRVIYDADARRAVVTSPGDGAALYDLRTGAELRRWTEEELPGSLRPGGDDAEDER